MMEHEELEHRPPEQRSLTALIRLQEAELSAFRRSTASDALPHCGVFFALSSASRLRDVL